MIVSVGNDSFLEMNHICLENELGSGSPMAENEIPAATGRSMLWKNDPMKPIRKMIHIFWKMNHIFLENESYILEK